MTEPFETLYPLVFIAAALAFGVLERVRTLQRDPVRMALRWPSNIGLFIIGGVLATTIVPIGIYGFALARPPGPISNSGLPFAAQVLLTFVLLDFWRYWEHRVYHRVPLLWRLHLVHHSDTHVDVTTSERHHPLDVVLGTATLIAVIAVLGPPAAAVGLYLLTATVVALYSHANLDVDTAWHRALGRFVVTAPVHAVHHSDFQAQTDSNYGSVLTIWDRLFGTYVDPARARIPNFGLRYFHLPADTRLARVLLQPFLYRRNLGYPAREHGDADGAPASVRAPATRMTRGMRDALLGALAGGALVCTVMWPTLVEMSAVWRGNESYQYAWLVLPMMVYVLVSRQGPAALPVDPRPGFGGVAVVMLAAVCWGAAALMNIDVGRQFALVLAIHGVAMSALGWRAYRRLFPVLALMFLMIPSGDLLQPVLRMLTVKAIELFALAAYLPHSVDGFVVFIGTHRYIVIDECSGLSYVLLATFLGYCFGLLLYRSFARIAALALFGALLGFVSNVVRVDIIVMIDWLRDSQMDLGAHGTIQWIALLATLGLLFVVLARLQGDGPAVVEEAAAPVPANANRKLAPVIAGLSGLLIAGSAAALPATDTAAPHRTAAAAFPQSLAGWTRVDAVARWAADMQRSTESVETTYRRDARQMHVIVVDALSPTAKLQPGELVLRDKGAWREKQVQRVSGCIAAGCVPLVHVTWQRDKGHDLRHVYYAYSVGAFITDSQLALRVAHGWDRLTAVQDQPRMTAFISDDGAADSDEIAAAFLALQAAINAADAG